MGLGVNALERDYVRACLVSWAGDVAAGAAAADPLLTILNIYSYNNGVVPGDVGALGYPICAALLLRMEITLTTAVPTTLCLQRTDPADMEYSRAWDVLKTTLTWPPRHTGFNDYDALIVADQYVTPPVMATLNSDSLQVGHLENVGDKLIWEWPDDYPYYISSVYDYLMGLTLFNAGAGVSGGLLVNFLAQIMPDRRGY